MTTDSFRPSILDQLQLFPLPVPPNVTPRPVTAEEKKRIDTLSELQFVSDSPRNAQYQLGPSSDPEYYTSRRLWLPCSARNNRLQAVC